MIDQVLCMHDGKPQWRNAGNWGLLTWDHQLPGVIIGTKMYVLKLSWDYDSYPASGTAEIRVRDYADRDNHTFVTYAKLNQIASDGNLSQDAYIFTDGTSLYYTGIVTWASLNDAFGFYLTPTKTVLYRLDSVDSRDIGSFTLVGTNTMLTSGGAATGWVYNGHPSLSWVDSCYVSKQSNWFNNTLEITRGLAFVDSYGSWDEITDEKSTNDIILLPYTTSMTSRKMSVEEHFSPRSMASNYIGGGAWNFVKMQEATQTLSMPGISNVGLTGYDANTNWEYPGQMTLTGVRPWFFKEGNLANPNGTLVPHPVAFSNNWNSDFSECYGMAYVMDERNLYSGSGSLVTRSYILNHGQSRLDLFDMPSYTPSYYSATPDAMVGLWGSVGAAIWKKARVISEGNSLHSGKTGVDYSDYYVIKGSDTANANRYSIFSGVEDDGSILHIEGLEDPTPSLWIDGTKVGDLN